MNTDILPREGPILCAVSGGADSMYLLCRLLELGYDTAAAHYDHCLRGAESDRDEAFVRDFCRARGVRFFVERGDVRAYAAAHHMGLEAAGRTLRYAFLERTANAIGAAAIATAHTADDNAETLLLHLARGTGLRGLGGIPPVRGRIVRPMLDVTRAQVEEYLRSRDIPWVEDSTNASADYARNRVRQGAVPALETVNPAFLRAAGQTAALLREDEAFLEGLARAFLDENAEEDAVDAAALTALPRPVAARAVRLLAGRSLAAEHVDAVLRTAARGGAADVPGLRVARSGNALIFGAAAGQAISARTLPVPGAADIPEAGLTAIAAKKTVASQVVHKSYNIFSFHCENICGSIMITGRLPGDRLRPVGRGCSKSLKQLFQEAGVPPWRRGSVPVLRDEAGILAVYGVGADERACARPGDREIIEIEFRPMPEKGGAEHA